MRQRYTIACFAAFAIAGMPSLAPAFYLEAYTVNPAALINTQPHVWVQDVNGNHQFIHWDLREMPGCTVPWSAHNGTADIAGLTEFDQINSAFGTWTAVTDSRINFNLVVPGAALPPLNLDGNNMIGFGGGLGAGVLALTDTWAVQSTGQMIESDILFNDPNYNWTIVGHNMAMGGNPDVRSVATHEIGHFIGLGHADGDLGIPPPLANPPGPIMNPAFNLNGNANHVLSLDDRDGCNFLYNPDLGDAPDPWLAVIGAYPSLVHDPAMGRFLNGVHLDGRRTGAEHIFGIKRRQPGRNYTYEWLGQAPGKTDDVDSECESDQVDNDAFDDGVSWLPNPPIWGKPLFIDCWVRDAVDNAGNSHDYLAHPIGTNLWVDLNQDGLWNLFPPEHVIHSLLAPPPLGIPNATRTTIVPGSVFLPKVAPMPGKPIWLRARVDWGEDSGQILAIDNTPPLFHTIGAAQFGEVEDYPLWCNNPYRQLWVQNLFALPPLSRMVIVVAGQPEPSSTTFNAIVNAQDCVQQTLNAPPIVSYDNSLDETTIDYFDPSVPEVPFLVWRHGGRCQPDFEPLAFLRAYWGQNNVIPDPSLWIPTTNVGIHPLPNNRIGIVIGVPSSHVGGWIAGSRGERAVWSDSLTVTAKFRIAPTLVPLDRLSPCDPLVQPLAQATLGTNVVIRPDRPFVTSIDADSVAIPHLIVEVTSSWTMNPTVSNEIYEFSDAFLGGGGVGIGPIQNPEDSFRIRTRPNPSTGYTIIEYVLGAASPVDLTIYDVSGRMVREIESAKPRREGAHAVVWDGRDSSGREVSAGFYIVRFTAEGKSESKKMAIVR